jgi:DNA polymerase-3 subunit delta'
MPTTWDNLIGHSRIRDWFSTAIGRDRMTGSFLLVGSPGVGKLTVANLLAQTLLCQRNAASEMQPCGTCEDCVQVLANTHPDVVRLAKPKDKTIIPLDLLIGRPEVRMQEGFCRDLRLKPFRGSRKVAILQDADFLNEEGANCLLKTLEEPPSGAVVILVGTSEQKQLPTIRSRCMHLPLRAVPESEIGSWLRDRVDAPDQFIDAAVKLSRGGPGKAIALAQNADTVLKPLTGFLGSLDRSNSKMDNILANSLSAQNAGASRQLFWEALQDVLQAQSVFSVTGEWTGAFKPLPVSKAPETWHKLWDKVCETQRVEAAINMDKKTVMSDMLSFIRAA